MSNLALPSGLAEQISELFLASTDRVRRDRNRKRVGKICEVDAEKGLVRVQLNEGKGGYPPMLSPWALWDEQSMGANRSHMPPSIGQQVELFSENGDFTDAVVARSLPSDDITRPSTAADEYILSMFADTLLRTKAGQALIKSALGELGDEGGPAVARVGDMVSVTAGSSAGLWPIVTGSDLVNAA